MKSTFSFGILVSSLFLSGCMSNYVFVLNDNQIKERYLEKEQKPAFKTYQSTVGKVHYVTNGDSTKPILVLIHGAPGHWYSSINIVEDTALLNHFYIIAYDRPGFGKSNNGYSIPYIDAQTSVIADIVAKENKSKQPVTVVGRSFGTSIAARYAMLYPKETKKLLLLASCIDPKKERFFWFTYVNKLGFVNYFMPKDLQSTSDEKFAHKKELDKMKDDWHLITSPTYIMHGTKDWIAAIDNAYYADKKIVNAPTKLYIMENSGHNVTWKHKNIVKQWLLEDVDSF